MGNLVERVEVKKINSCLLENPEKDVSYHEVYRRESRMKKGEDEHEKL